MITNGTKNAISILEVTLKEVKVTDVNPKEKEVMLQSIQYIIDAMQFAKGKIKVIKNRIKIGERLESKEYANEHLDKFLQTIKEERVIDSELGLILEGNSDKVRSKLNILKYMYKDKQILGTGLATANTFGFFGAYQAGAAGMQTDDAVKLIALIVGTSMSIMLSLSIDAFRHEEIRRNGIGKVGRFLKLPK